MEVAEMMAEAAYAAYHVRVPESWNLLDVEEVVVVVVVLEVRRLVECSALVRGGL